MRCMNVNKKSIVSIHVYLSISFFYLYALAGIWTERKNVGREETVELRNGIENKVFETAAIQVRKKSCSKCVWERIQ